MNDSGFPVARTNDLIVKELAGETVIYDLAAYQAHCLNETAHLVWKHADGRRSPEELAALLAARVGRRVEADEVWLALDQLAERGLLQQPVRRPAEEPSVTRRELVKRLGKAAAIGIPLITSIVAPTPAQAQTGGGIPG